MVSLYIINVNCDCNYIRRDNIAYELDQCSFTSNLSPTNTISWGFYCVENDGRYIAEYRQWNSDKCDPNGESPDVTLFNIDCNGDEDDCDCTNEFTECSVATFRIENCANNTLYQETKRIYQLCKKGTDSSQQLICDNGDSLKRMQYENDQCEGYGFEINSNEFDNNDISLSVNATQTLEPSEICAEIICISGSLRTIYSKCSFIVTIIITLAIKLNVI